MNSRSIQPYFAIKHRRTYNITKICIPSSARVPFYAKGDGGALVSIGDTVQEGQLIAYNADGTGVHAPIPGRVEGIEQCTLADLWLCYVISIKLGGSFNYTGKHDIQYPWQNRSTHEILELTRLRGLVQLDGSEESLASVLQSIDSEHSVIINAAYGTPYVIHESKLLKQCSAQVIESLHILQRIHSDLNFHIISTSQADMQDFKLKAKEAGIDVKIHKARARYPEGSTEYIAAHTLQKLQTPYTIFTVSTLLSFYEGVVLEKSLIEHSITLGASAIGGSIPIKVRIGTPVRTIFQELSISEKQAHKVILGLPIQGHELKDLNSPITKSIRSIFVFNEQEVLVNKELPCIRCGKCVEYCPAHINPAILQNLLKNGRQELAEKHDLHACWLCGICSHICPSHIPLTRILKEAQLNSIARAFK